MAVQAFGHNNSTNLDFSQNLATSTSGPKVLNGLTISGLLVFSSTLLHLGRNISGAYYGIWAGTIAVFVVFLIRSGQFEARRNFFFLTILGLFLYCCIISYYWSSNFGDPLIGIARLGFIIPVILVIAYTPNIRSFDMFCMLWLGFATLAALSLPLQFIVGPISWFSESFERVGVSRFGSLAGSLTTFGNMVGTAVFIAVIRFRKFHYIILIVLILMLATVLSLQKAAIGSLAIALITILLTRRFKFTTFIILTALVASIALLAFYFSDYQTRGTILLLFDTFFGSVEAGQASDVSIFQSASDRIFELPVAAFDYYGSHAAWVGIGVFGGSGSLGYPSLPHTHNLVGETILLFGLLPGGLVIALILVMLFHSVIILTNLSQKYDARSVMAAGILINITVPSIFAGALLYHPAGATIFFVSLFQLYYRKSLESSLITPSKFPAYHQRQN